ncbi:MAG TPA: superoxide dismutase family protein [Burkholderiaceae bacterium]|nr:superoxide dismutase family protein [Burkholderiaceae bacterium]
MPALLLGAALAGCASDSAGPTAGATAATRAAPVTATAQLKPTQGNTAAGTVWFTQQGLRVDVRVQVTGLTPNQEHGFHVHEKGDCSSPDGMSAGGHFNPGGQPHGPQNAPHHGGDMPSLKADASGNAQASFQLQGVSVGTGIDGLLGRGVIVHAKPDDYTTQPTGNSGARIACGVVVSS